MRSGTLDAPGHRRLRRRRRGGGQEPAGVRRPGRRAARRPDRAGTRRRCRTRSQRRPGRTGCPATRTSPSPAARATRCCCCSTRRASPAPPARPARRAWRSPRTCCWPWAPTTTARAVVAALHPRPHLDRRPTSTPWSPPCRPRSSGPAGPGWSSPADRRADRPPPAGGYARSVRVLAAMSGGVDSAVAAARAVDAGHDVTGVHLALSRNPQTYRSGARGCCTLEDARDARRAADVIGIPFYVWDLAERFHEDVVDDFVAEYAAGRTPNPCLRCNEKIKFAAVLDRARGAGLRRGGHRPPRPARRRRPAAPQRRPGQGPVVRARGAHPRPARPVDVPARRLDQGAGARRGGRRAGWRSPTSPTRTTSASSPTATPAASWPSGWARRPATSSTATTGAVVGAHEGAYGYTVGQRKGLDLRRARAGRPPALRAVDHPDDQHGDGRPGRGPRCVHRGRVTVRCGPVRRRTARSSARCSCARTATSVPAVVTVRRRRPDAPSCASRPGASRPARRSSRTGPTRPATSCSGRPPSRRLRRSAGDLTGPGRRARRPASVRCPAPTSPRRSASSSASCPTCRTCRSCRPAGRAPT